MNKKLKMFDEKIKNSKLQITKNLWQYVIAPAVILLVGIILLCTIGFNGNTQLTGGSTFTIYINAENKIEDAVQYDIDKDYQKVCNQIISSLSDGNLKAESFQKTEIDIEGVVAGGAAIKVIYKNTSKDLEKIKLENEAIRNRILADFGYNSVDDAVSVPEYFAGKMTTSWLLTLVSAVIFAVTVALIYMAIRTRSASWLLGLLQIAVDLFMFVGLLLICRVPVGYTVGISTVVCAVMSIINVCAFYSKAKNNIYNGSYNNFKPSKMADSTAKDLGLKKIVIYLLLFVFVLIMSVMPVRAVQEVALGIMLALVSTFYTSSFILPAIWTASYKPAKIKNKDKKEASK